MILSIMTLSIITLNIMILTKMTHNDTSLNKGNTFRTVKLA